MFSNTEMERGANTLQKTNKLKMDAEIAFACNLVLDMATRRIKCNGRLGPRLEAVEGDVGIVETIKMLFRTRSIGEAISAPEKILGKEDKVNQDITFYLKLLDKQAEALNIIEEARTIYPAVPPQMQTSESLEMLKARGCPNLVTFLTLSPSKSGPA